MYAYIKTHKVTFEFILSRKLNFSSFLTWFHCLIIKPDSPINLILLIICQSNANLKTERNIQNKLFPLKFGKSFIMMGLHGKAVIISKESRFLQL